MRLAFASFAFFSNSFRSLSARCSGVSSFSVSLFFLLDFFSFLLFFDFLPEFFLLAFPCFFAWAERQR